MAQAENTGQAGSFKAVIRKKAVIRVSCLVIRENLGIRAGLRRAQKKPCLVIRVS